MNEAADRMHVAEPTPVTGLRQLSREYAEGKLTLTEYRRARASLLDGLVSGTIPLEPYQPPEPSLATRVANQHAMPDVDDPTLRIRRPSRVRGALVVLGLVVLLIVALIAGYYG